MRWRLVFKTFITGLNFLLWCLDLLGEIQVNWKQSKKENKSFQYRKGGRKRKADGAHWLGVLGCQSRDLGSKCDPQRWRAVWTGGEETDEHKFLHLWHGGGLSAYLPHGTGVRIRWADGQERFLKGALNMQSSQRSQFPGWGKGKFSTLLMPKLLFLIMFW